jgi:hypothetical protein
MGVAPLVSEALFVLAFAWSRKSCQSVATERVRG